MLSRIETINWDQFIRDLGELDSWLRELEIEVKHRRDRLHQAIEVLKEARTQGDLDLDKPHLDLRQKWPDFYLMLGELLEFQDILKALRGESPDILRPRLKRMLKGTLSPRQETPDNSQARNTAFELALASEWCLRGLRVKLREPDIKVWLNGVPFLVACKRPFFEDRINENVRSAASQIRKELSRSDRRNQWGIIAISVSRILLQGRMIFRAQTDQDLESLGDSMVQLLDRQERRWARAAFDRRIKAVIFHCGATAIIEARSRWSRIAYSVYRSIGREDPIFEHIRMEFEQTQP